MDTYIYSVKLIVNVNIDRRETCCPDVHIQDWSSAVDSTRHACYASGVYARGPVLDMEVRTNSDGAVAMFCGLSFCFRTDLE
jgi:hypothetical protein